MKPKIICIVGPTASGKTGLSIELAKKIDAEIISADSMQIYKKLDIGTAKIKEEEKEGIRHHLIDICDINEKFSVAEFKKMCYDKIEEILSRKKQVIIVGGTGLYINAVVDNMSFDEENIDYDYRRYLENLAKEKSNEYVYSLLEKVDPKSALKIHSNNLKRVIRALEIYNNSNKLKSTHMEEEIKRKNSEESKYQFFVFYIEHERNKRVDMMIEEGLEKEARYVYDLKLPNDLTCMQAIGYKEFFPYFEGKITLEQVVYNIKQATRRYAKRQITWFKNKLNVIYLNGSKKKEELVKDIIDYIKN